MKKITIKNKGTKIGTILYDETREYSISLKLYRNKTRNTYREIEAYYDDISYTPYPKETLRGIVMSYEEDSEKITALVEKIKDKNNIKDITPFKPIKLYGIPSSHLRDFGLTDNLHETMSIKFIEDISEFINANRKYIKRTEENGFEVDIINDEINDLNKIYQNYLEANDDDVKNYLYPHLRDGYIDIIERFKELTGRNFFYKKRIYPLI